MKINSTLFNAVCIILVSFGIMMTSGCGDDPVQGCTDPNAENYDASAEEDDGSCVLARDKFVGNYNGGLNCQLLPISGDDTDFTLAPGLADNEIFINITSGTAAGLGFPGTVSGNTITVSTTLESLALFDITMDGMVDQADAADLEVSGSVTTNDGGQTLSGTLNAQVTHILSGIQLPDACGFTATKQ